MFKRILFSAALLSICSTSVFAQTVVFNNLDGAGAPDSTVPNDIDSAFAGENVDDVTLATTTQVTGINWSGVYEGTDDAFVSADLDNFVINIYADAGGAPGALDTSFAVGNDVNRQLGDSEPIGAGGASVQTFDYSAEIDFTFDAGVTYWVSTLDNTDGDTDNFALAAIQTGGNSFIDFGFDGNFTPLKVQLLISN